MERADNDGKPIGRGGALIGWRRAESDHGIVVRLQIAASADDVRNQRWETIDLALNDRQLRSLTRDLMRAAKQRGLDLFAPKSRLFGFRRRPPLE